MDYKIVDGVRYTQKHEWVRPEGETAKVGLSDYAQDKLGEIVFVELPEVGAVVEAGKSSAVIESVKAVADLYAPIDGKVIEVNEELLDQPELINSDPYGEGWVYKVEIKDGNQLEVLMDKKAYEVFVAEEEE
ncbi:MAG: glycine cleavage system protein H [Firmicutes bacterium ML8_F2]|nr:MAG: glycine cleavage system protein H [Firmicutes bacterium ML8_F2]